MLLRYFRKIDAYSGIRVIAAGIITFCIVWSTDYSNWQELLLSFALGSLMLWLCWTILRDRWVLKTSALRIITYFLLSIHWSAEFDIMDLIFFSLVIEINWHLAESHKRKESVLSVLNSGTLTALSSLWMPQEMYFLAGAVLLIWLVSGGIKFKTLLQWGLSFCMIILPLIYFSEIDFNLKRSTAASNAWWIFMAGLSLLAIAEFIQSYLKANQTNKNRSLIVGLWIVLGGICGWWYQSTIGTVICVLGMSYHLANGIRYFRRGRTAETLFLFILAFVMVSYFDLIKW